MRERVKWDGLVLRVLDLLEMGVGDLLMLYACRVVITDQTWDLG